MNNLPQIPLDFSGKRTCKRTVALTPECDNALLAVAKFTDKDPATILAEYCAERIGDDFGKLLILQTRGKISIPMPQV